MPLCACGNSWSAPHAVCAQSHPQIAVLPVGCCCHSPQKQEPAAQQAQPGSQAPQWLRYGPKLPAQGEQVSLHPSESACAACLPLENDHVGRYSRLARRLPAGAACQQRRCPHMPLQAGAQARVSARRGQLRWPGWNASSKASTQKCALAAPRERHVPAGPQGHRVAPLLFTWTLCPQPASPCRQNANQVRISGPVVQIPEKLYRLPAKCKRLNKEWPLLLRSLPAGRPSESSAPSGHRRVPQTGHGQSTCSNPRGRRGSA